MRVSAIILTTLLLSCSTEEIVQEIFDITPPTIENIQCVDSNTLKIDSNEPIYFDRESFFSPSLVISDIRENQNSIEIDFTNAFIPGKDYTCDMKLLDKNSNYNQFQTLFYGYNPELPNVIINEFICKGTKSNPDKIELYVVNNGNLAGLTLYSGTKYSYESKFIFPDINVREGEYITIRSTSEKYPLEYVEKENLSVDYDPKFTPESRDIRTNNLVIPGSNGVLSLYDSPLGEMIDTVVYTKNSNEDDKRYRNFGLSKTLERISTVEETGLWSSETGEIYPNDAINIDTSTTTRSINRRDHIDSNSKTDWYICPTKEASFGSENSDNVY